MSIALLATATAVGTALFTAGSTRSQNRASSALRLETDTKLEQLRAELAQGAKIEDRQFADLVLIDRYQKPLLTSAVELRSRIGNIRFNGSCTTCGRTIIGPTSH